MNAHQITLPVSGAVLSVRRQPLDIIMNAQMRAMEMHERPQPPLVKEEVGPDKFIERENVNDAAYIAALKAYEAKWQQSFAQMLLKILVRTCIVSDEVMRAHLDEARELQATYQEIGIPVSDNLLEFALEYIIAISKDDMEYLMMEVFGKTLPKEGQVALRAQMFRSEVQTA